MSWLLRGNLGIESHFRSHYFLKFVFQTVFTIWERLERRNSGYAYLVVGVTTATLQTLTSIHVVLEKKTSQTETI